MRLNLGCSDRHLPDWTNVDRVAPADQIVDLSRYPWPWPDSSVDEIKADDIFEHLPSKLHTMNEAHRILKPGGRLRLFVPTTDGRGAFQDPTHITFWTPNDLFYFVENYAEWIRFHEAYGITARFSENLNDTKHEKFPNEVWKLSCVLIAVKPDRTGETCGARPPVKQYAGVAVHIGEDQLCALSAYHEGAHRTKAGVAF